MSSPYHSVSKRAMQAANDGMLTVFSFFKAPLPYPSVNRTLQ